MWRKILNTITGPETAAAVCLISIALLGLVRLAGILHRWAH